MRATALARRFGAVIFDKDGTLLDFALTWDRGISEALGRVHGDEQRQRAADVLGFDLSAKRALRDPRLLCSNCNVRSVRVVLKEHV